MLSIGLVAAFIAVLFNLVYCVAAKYMSPRTSKYKLAVIVLGAGIIPMLADLFLTTKISIAAGPVAYALASGVFLCAGYILYYKTLQTEQISNTSAIGSLQNLIVLLFGVFALGEGVAVLQVLGMVAVFAGVILVATKQGLKLNRFLVPAIFANISWAIYWIILTYGINLSGSSIFPTVIARITAFFAIFIYAIATGKLTEKQTNKKSVSRPNLLFIVIIIAGFADAAINISYSVAISVGLVAIGSAIIAAVPIFVALLGRVIYKDRLTKLQLIGIIMAVLGTAIISIA